MSLSGIGGGPGLFGDSLPVIESVLGFANQRHAVLANNVANVDTPGFRAKDLPEADFQKALRAAVESRRNGAEPLVLGTGGNLRRAADGGVELRPVESGSGVMRGDGNDVALDQEMSKLLKNAMTIQVFNRMLAGKFQSLGLAIRGRL
ncbi:MAG TPA: flagellar basal body rod protein FlgB [Planctomycetota bacterium]|nr:flagellar basal body rod protein FlgB [Planctomycetota bacterium]